MGEGYFFTPKPSKLIIPVSSIIIAIYIITVSSGGGTETLIRILKNPEYIFFGLFGLLIIYYFSCSCQYFIDTKIRKKFR